MIPAKDLYSICGMMLRENWGYIYGTSGEKWSDAKQTKYKAKYEGDVARKMSCKYGGKWAGHMVTDCSGVMVYIWHQHGMSIYHGSNTIRKKYCGETVKNPKPGYAAFKVRNDSDYYHIGIVAEDGLNVYEAKSTQTGFVMSAASSWHCFAPFKDVDYGGEQMEPFSQYLAVVDTKRDPLNVREKPDINAKVIFRVMKGEGVWVMKDMGNGWARIEEDGMEGYASMQYLKKAADLPVDGPLEEETKQPEPPAILGVFIPCENEDAAARYVGDIKGAVIIRADKPPDA